MTTIERSATISASAEEVDDLLMDVTQVAEVWDAHSAEPDEVWPAPGGKLVSIKKMAGMSMTTNFTMIEHTRGKSHQAKMSGAFDGVMSWTFAPENGGTHLTINMEYDIGGGALGKAVNKIVIERAVTSTADNLIKNVKAIAEG